MNQDIAGGMNKKNDKNDTLLLHTLPSLHLAGYHPGSSTLVSSIAVSSTPSSSTTALSTQLKQCNGYLDSN